ncbi:hypothetical protein ACJ2_00580 [Pantoea sp. QMID2]|nr:hypothetical protein ACJ3_00580 [Pantoea sp. QMID3]GME49967.1 hypothetical protein ACJ2_00580 [Pantoea sp. QMID2]
MSVIFRDDPPESRDNWYTVRCIPNTYTNSFRNVSYGKDYAPHFWQWLDCAAKHDPARRDIILAALFMVLANRFDWQLFLEITGGSGKSIMDEIATMPAGADNTTSATIETLES